MTTWDPANTNAEITLTGGNLIATLTGAGSADVATYGTVSRSTGKWTYSALLNTAGAHGLILGLSTTLTTVTGYYIGDDTSSVGYKNTNGGILLNNATLATVQTSGSADTVWIAVDIDAKLFWVRIDAGNWNNNGANNPDAGTGGISIAGLGAFTLFPGLSEWTANDQVTGDFATASGLTTFTPWNGVTVPASSTNWSNGFRITGATATQGPYELLGGKYKVSVHTGTWNGATVALSILGPDGSTYVATAASFTADGTATIDLPPCLVQMTVSVATPTSVNFNCVPVSWRR